jgi:hypothetical protein
MKMLVATEAIAGTAIATTPATIARMPDASSHFQLRSSAAFASPLRGESESAAGPAERASSPDVGSALMARLSQPGQSPRRRSTRAIWSSSGTRRITSAAM